MTRKREDKNPPSPFSEWLRNRDEIDSEYGFSCTNIDYMWTQNIVSGKNSKWLLLEEKRYVYSIRYVAPSQFKAFYLLDKTLKDANSTKYHGLHFIGFEKESPDDGRMFWDGIEITTEILIKILKFEYPPNHNYYTNTLLVKNKTLHLYPLIDNNKDQINLKNLFEE